MTTEAVRYVGNATNHKNRNHLVVQEDKDSLKKDNDSFFCEREIDTWGEKGETREQDRAKPQPRKKKEREESRKKKKIARLERQKSRMA